MIEYLSGDFNRGYTRAIQDIIEIFEYIEPDLKYHRKGMTSKLAIELLKVILVERGGRNVTKPYQKTAKDLAWDRERSRLQSEIIKLRKRLFLMSAELGKANETIEQQKNNISRLSLEIEKVSSFIGLSKEELDVLLSEEKNRATTNHLMKRLAEIGFGGFLLASATKELREDCPACGGKGTMVGYRASSNGHFWGACEVCHCRVME